MTTKKKGKSAVDDFYAEMSVEIKEAESHTGVWRANQQKWHRMRMRIKKKKVFPFIGCSNLRMPTIETKIRKLKSQLVKIIWGIRPVVQAIPSPSGDWGVAQKIEKLLDHLVCDIIKVKRKAIIGIDQALEKGFYLFKPYWRVEITTRIEEYALADLSLEEAMAVYSLDTTDEMLFGIIRDFFDVDMHDLVADENTEIIQGVISDIRGGKDKIKVEFQDVLYNFPDVALCNPESTYVPSDSTVDPQDARMIVHDFYLPYNTVKRNVELKGWSKSAVDSIEVLKGLDLTNLTEAQKDMREGIERINNPSRLVRIQEVYVWRNITSNEFEERCTAILAPEFNKTLREPITLPLNNGKWPFVKIFFELMDDRWFSHRGIPEIIEDLVKEIDTQHNQKIDGQTFRNVPIFSYKAGVVNPNLVKFIPGQAVPRQDADDIKMLTNPNLAADISYEKEQMLLESKIEELLGQVDFTLQSMINRRQPRTLGEVQYQVQGAQMVFSLDADMFAEGFGELFSFVWDLWCQYGDDEYEFSYFGQEGWEKIKLTKEETQGKYKIVVRGNDQNTNPQVKLTKAQMILDASRDQIALQAGVIQPHNIYNAYKRFYQVMDEQNWQEFITEPPQQGQKPPEGEPVKLDFKSMTDAEKMQVLAKAGIRPDVEGRALTKQQEIEGAGRKV